MKRRIHPNREESIANITDREFVQIASRYARRTQSEATIGRRTILWRNAFVPVR